MRALQSEVGHVKGILLLSVLLFISFFGFEVGKHYYDYYRLKTITEVIGLEIVTVMDKMKSQAADVSTTQASDDAKNEILRQARGLGIRIDDSDISIAIVSDSAVARPPGEPPARVKFSANIKWTKTVNLFNFYKKNLDFVIDIK